MLESRETFSVDSCPQVLTLDEWMKSMAQVRLPP